MAALDLGYVFIWIGVGFTLILTGIIISSIRRSIRRAQLARIHTYSMPTFRGGALSRNLARLIEEQLAVSWATKLASAPLPPSKAMWGWAPLASNLEEVNFHYVILSSPKLLEQAAKSCFEEPFGTRHPSQSLDDYLAMIRRMLPAISKETIAGYLETYNMVLFELGEVSKRQYTAWLTHFTSILKVLDQNMDSTDDLQDPSHAHAPVVEKSRKKKKKRSKET